MILKRIHLTKSLKKRLYFGKGYMKLRVPFGTKDICNRTQKKNWKDRKLWWRKILGYCTWFLSNYTKSIIQLFKAILDKKSVWTMKRMTRERERKDHWQCHIMGNVTSFPRQIVGKIQALRLKEDSQTKNLMNHSKYWWYM